MSHGTCNGKLIYGSQGEADRVRKKRYRQRETRRLRSYKFPTCKGWHLTSQKFRKYDQ